MDTNSILVATWILSTPLRRTGSERPSALDATIGLGEWVKESRETVG